MRIHLLVLLGFTVGCTPIADDTPPGTPGPPGGDPDEDPDEDPDDGRPCPITLSEPTPEDGETAFNYRDSMEAEFSAVDASVEPRLVSWSGDEVPGSGVWFDERYVWTPDAPLEPASAYTWSLTYCDGSDTYTADFATSLTGTPVDPADIDGGVFAVDLTSGTFIDPPGVGALLQAQLDLPFLVSFTVDELDPSRLTLLASAADEDSPVVEQDLCQPTSAFPDVDFEENPWFVSDPGDIELEVQGLDVVFEDAVLAGAFTFDGNAIEEGLFVTRIDTRPPGGPVQGQNPGEVCHLAETYGIPCVPCPNGEPFCIDVTAVGLRAERIPGQLVPRDEATIASDPTCP